jgi:hypothetical protein
MMTELAVRARVLDHAQLLSLDIISVAVGLA